MTTPRDAYRALQHAAEQIGANTYRQQLTAHIKAGRSPRTFRFSPTAAHLAIVDMMPAVLSGRVEVEAAYALLHNPEIDRERFD